jgi:DNA-binding GntR family transcriptional regulator
MTLNIGDAIHPKNTADLIADALRSAILQGKLRSGQSLKQDEIANEFNVSKIPVREALVQLQAEGLVQMIKSRGATVTSLTIEEVTEIYAIRSALEPIALRRAIPHIKPSDYYHIEQILNKIDHEDDMRKWAELNWEFHAALYRAAGMPRLTQTVQTLYNNVARYLLQNYLDRDYLAESQRQHREILEACRNQQVDDATELLLHHLGDPVQVFAGLLDS